MRLSKLSIKNAELDSRTVRLWEREHMDGKCSYCAPHGGENLSGSQNKRERAKKKKDIQWIRRQYVKRMAAISD